MGSMYGRPWIQGIYFRLIKYIFTIIALICITTSCSTITKNPQTPLTIITVCAGSSKPAPAKCIISNPYMHKEVITPAVIAVGRSSHDLSIKCSIKDKVFGEAIIKSSFDVDSSGNLFFGGIVGLATDFVTGSAYKYQPKIQLLLDCKNLNILE